MSSARSSASGRRCRRRSREAQGATLSIDQATRANLELVRTLGGERRGSLLAAIDRTVTAAGSRLLAQRLAAPLTDPAAIGGRLDTVEIFVGDAIVRQQTRELLHIAPDMARALSRLVVGRGGPRDLAAIRDGIAAAAALAARLDKLPRQARRDRRARSRRCASPTGAVREELDGGARRRTAAVQARRRLRARTATTPRSMNRARCATNRAR